MKITWCVPVVMTLALGGCDRIKGLAASDAGEAGAAAVGTAPATAAPKREEENLFAAGAGAMVVSFDPENTTNYDEWQMLDDNPASYWMPGARGAKVYKLTLALPQLTTVKKLSFFGSAKTITVEATPSAQAKDAS
jgi:hypothetical protein